MGAAGIDMMHNSRYTHAKLEPILKFLIAHHRIMFSRILLAYIGAVDQ